MARLTRLLALLFPPAVVLASVHELYLRNQAELGRTLSVLFPFWAAAAIAVAAGLLLQRGADRTAAARAGLWAYFAAGSAFLLWSYLRGMPLGGHFVRWALDTGAGAATFAAAAVAAVPAIVRRTRLQALEPGLAVLALVFAGREAVLFAARLDRRPPAPPRDVVAEFGAGGDRALPNVYHLLLDSFQDELFEPCLPSAAAGVLDGFVRFRLDSPARSTDYVVPSVFTGRWLPVQAGYDREREALVGDESVLQDLRRRGYRSLAFIPRYIYSAHRDAFDLAVFHDEHSQATETAGLHAATLRRLWLYSILPLSLGERLARAGYLGLDSETFREAAEQRAAAFAAPVLSGAALEELIELEPRLPGRGRYSFVHALLPHPPYVLASDCSHSGALRSTDLRRQTDCTLRLVVRFLEKLRSLGRLDESIVLIHGDHGAGLALVQGGLVPSETAKLRTVLLVKPAGAHGPLSRARHEARVIDVAPTLLALVGVGPHRSFDGRTLDEVLPPRAAR